MSESLWDRMSCGRWIGEKWRSAVLDRVPKLWAPKNVGKLSSDLWKGPSMSKHIIYYWWWYNENYTNPSSKQNDFLLLSWPSDFRLGYHLPICMVIRCRRRKRIWLLHLVQLITVCLYPWKLSSRAMKMREKKIVDCFTPTPKQQVTHMLRRYTRDICAIQSYRRDGANHLVTLRSVIWPTCPEDDRQQSEKGADRPRRITLLPSGWVIEPITRVVDSSRYWRPLIDKK